MFTCFITRTTHLESAKDLSTDGWFLVLKDILLEEHSLLPYIVIAVQTLVDRLKNEKTSL